MNDDQLQNLLVRGYDSAPPHIQKFIQDGKVGSFVMGVQASAQMHADVADSVSNQILLTLLGILSPAELPETLKKEVGLSDAQIGVILNEANKTIFIPLRDELSKSQPSENESGAEVSETRFEPLEEIPERNVTSMSAPSRVPVPPPSYAPPAPPIAQTGPVYDFSQPQGPVNPVPTQTAPMMEPVAALSPEPAQTPIPQGAVPQAPTMRTFASDVEQMKHGQAPHAYSQGSPPTFTPTPAPQAVPTVAPRTVAAVPPPKPAYVPPPAPTVTPPPPIPPIAQPPSQTPVPTHPPRRPEPTVQEVTHSLKQYGIDPYREPVE